MAVTSEVGYCFTAERLPDFGWTEVLPDLLDGMRVLEFAITVEGQAGRCP